jgi:hypothetical protein
LGLAGDWSLGENGWKTGMDLNLLTVSVLLHGSVDDIVAAEPGSPAAGDKVILDDTHATHPNEVAVYDAGAWVYLVVPEGTVLLNETDGLKYELIAGIWTALSGGGGGDLLAANNLSDVASASTSRTNLGAAAEAPDLQAVTSSATVTPTFSDDLVKITAQAAGLTLANWSGTAVEGWGMAIRIKDDGTARAILYGSKYRAIGVTLPTTTVIGKTLYLGCIYNLTDDKIDVVAVAQEA